MMKERQVSESVCEEENDAQKRNRSLKARKTGKDPRLGKKNT